MRREVERCNDLRMDISSTLTLMRELSLICTSAKSLGKLKLAKEQQDTYAWRAMMVNMFRLPNNPSLK